jgi:hypothetical protein
MFADTHTFGRNEDQLTGYVNRFGPGMVIYWFGYVDTVQYKIPDVLVRHEFPDPSSIVTMNADTHASSQSSEINNT